MRVNGGGSDGGSGGVLGFGAWGCFQVARTVKGVDCKFEAQVQVNMEKVGAMLQVPIL